MDKIKETYENASWIFRELITLDAFKKEIIHLSKTLDSKKESNPSKARRP